MADTDRDRVVDQTNDSKPKTEEPKRKVMNDKLRKKLEKLKKDDPNIYPVF